MEENEKRDINMVAMEVIMNAGDGRDKIDEALAAMAEGKLDEVDKLRQLGENELVGYLIPVTRNNAIDMRRRQKRWEKHCFYTDDPSIFDQVCADTSVEDEIIRQADVEMLYQALKQLPRRERKLLKRKYMDEAPDKEIAQELGVAPASVRTYLSRARNHLREIMEEMDK